MSDSSVDEPERKIKLENYYFQRRILFSCTVGLFFGIILWIIGMATNRWFIVSGGNGIFVESHRRFFKSSHTGIWRNCRYALIPQPIDSNIIRNYTTFTAHDSKLAKKRLITEDFLNNFPTEPLPDLDNITDIENDILKQHMFAEWLNDNEAKFNKLKEKFDSLDVDERVSIKETIYVDPSQESTRKLLEGLVFNIQFNKTHQMHLAISEDLKEALFDGWNEHGMSLVWVLSNYGRSLGANPMIARGHTRYIFKPPTPEKYHKKSNSGFIYLKWSRCKYHNLFANSDELAADPSVDEELLDLSRTAASFSIVTIFVMILGFIFTVYTFLNPRYMFKRLAGGVHFIAGLSSITVCKLMSACVNHAHDHLAYAFPKDATFSYGFGFYFGCLVSMINFISCVMFFWYSKKQKGDKAATEELGMADERIQIGR